MKINEVIAVYEDDTDDQKIIKNILSTMGNKMSWSAIQKDPTKLEDERIVDGIKYKGYVDTKLNTFYVYDEAEGKYVVADRNFTRRFFGKNFSARTKKFLNFGADKSAIEKFKSMFDFNDPAYAGAGERIKYANTKGFRGRFARAGATAGGLSSKGGRAVVNYVKNKFKGGDAPEEIKDAWQKVYGIKAPQPGDELTFKTSDGKVFNATVIQLVNVDSDNDGVPDLQIKGFFDPLRPKIPTVTGIPSSRVISIKGKQLIKQVATNTPQASQQNDPGAI